MLTLAAIGLMKLSASQVVYTAPLRCAGLILRVELKRTAGLKSILRMNKDFKDFQKYFKEYQAKFGLNGWQVYFKHGPVDDAFANVRYTLGDMVATVWLNSKLSKGDKPFKDIRKSAKHEALHLLIARLEGNACHRWVSRAEIEESSEELVNKLDSLID